MEVFHYITPDNKNPFREWFRSLRDPRAKAATFRRIDRLADNNFGDHKFCRDGVWDLKIDVGPGYRVYYARVGETTIVLLCAGSKRTQRKEIVRAVALLEGLSRAITMKQKPYITHNEAAIEMLHEDPQFAVEYLNAVLEDGDQKELMLALRRIAEAFGGVSKLAEQAELNATTLYRTLSPQGNPELKSLTSILKAMGMRIAVQPFKPAR
jgi:putative addiction module killer protein/probable addiction module antidote protein